MQPFDTYDDLLDTVEQYAGGYRVLGRAPGGRPVVAAEAGGEKEPAIVLTTGAHATEQAGVVATVELLDRLDTDHQVHVIPTRDPLGVDGYAAALEMAIGEPVAVDGYDDVEAIIREEGDVVLAEGDAIVGLVGDYAFASAPPTDEEHSMRLLSNVIADRLEDADVREQLRGRRIFLTPGEPDVEGTGHFERLYTLVVSLDGEKLHLNRYIGSDWAPAESRSVRQLFDEVDPGLFVDVHEYHGDDYWVSVRGKDDADDAEWEERVGRAMIETVGETGARPLPLEELLGDTDPADSFFSELEDGLYDLDYRDRGEGFNATDYAAEYHGLAFTNETGMTNPFEERVSTAIASVSRAVEEFEQRYE